MNNIELKQWRTDKELTQSQLAQLFGVSLRTIQNWEAGNKDINNMVYFATQFIDTVENIDSYYAR